MENPFTSLEARFDKIEAQQKTILDILERKHLDEFLTVDEVMELTGFARQTIYQKVNNNSIPSMHVGRALRFKRSEILAWIQNGK